MKKTKNLRKLFALLLALGMLLSLSIGVSASEVQSTENTKEWTLLDDGARLSDGMTAYYYYELPFGTWFRPYRIYDYSQSIEYDKYTSYSVGQPMHEGEATVYPGIACVYSYTTTYGFIGVYATASGAQMLDAFCQGEYARYDFVIDHYEGTVMSEEAVGAWCTASPDCTVDVSTLRDAECYEILGYDETLTFAHAVGAVFVKDGQYLFVHYDALPNNCFDSNGYFSFRSGSVPALRLDEVSAAKVEEYKTNMSEFSTEITYESNIIGESFAILIAWLMLMPILFIPPVLLFALGIVLFLIGKGKTKWRWISVVGLSLVWLVLSILITALCIVAMFL